MATLTEPKIFDRSGPWDLSKEPLPPEGTFFATCLGVEDRFGVERPAFNDPTQIEKQDLTWFLFGFRDEKGAPHRIATREMKISGSEKSNLFKFLRSWLGKPFPYGQDYASMKAKPALITISHVARKSGDGCYASIVTVAPVPAGMQAQRPAAPAQAPQVPAYAPPSLEQSAVNVPVVNAPSVPANSAMTGDEIPF